MLLCAAQSAAQSVKLWLTGHQPHPVQLLGAVVVVGQGFDNPSWVGHQEVKEVDAAPVPLALHRQVDAAAARGYQ